MESSEDKQWASKYLLDPLTGAEPSQETGPGSTPIAKTPSSSPSILRKPVPSTSVRSSTGRQPSEKQGPSISVRSSKNPYRNGTPSSGYPSPPPSASPRTERFPTLNGAASPNRNSTATASTAIPTSTSGRASTIGEDAILSRRSGGPPPSNEPIPNRRRGSSLNQRYQGDQSHRPLEMLRKDAKAAHRAPHLRKKHHVGTDTIDSLDKVGGGPYHHEGPYDATLLARNTNFQSSPLEAVSTSNEEALRATPREKIIDSVEKHYPLDGVAVVPPGVADRYGRTYKYQEGSDMMIDNAPEGGAYKRWPGMQYHPSDLKGKGEPSYSIEKALKEHKAHRRNVSEGNNAANAANAANAYEMHTPRARQKSSSHVPDGRYGHRRGMSADSTTNSVRPVSEGERYAEWEASGPNRSASGKLRRRFGSLRMRD